jgi:hypothetical protein
MGGQGPEADFRPASLRVRPGHNFRVARENEAARAADATAWVRSAVAVFTVR